MDVKNLSLFPATEAQIKVHRERTFEPWGRGLDLESFCQRDIALGHLPHAAHGRWQVWILAPRENAPTNLDFFCSCETYEREVVVSGKGTMLGYGVASVITPPRHRGKGYARHMMRLLHYILADRRLSSTFPPFPLSEWGAPPAVPAGFGRGIASALYSDVGPTFYQQCGIGTSKDNGWIVKDPEVTIWQVPDDTPLPSNLEPLTEETQEEVWEADAKLIQDEVGGETPTTTFAFLPNRGVANFLQARSFFYEPSTREGGVWGCKMKDLDHTRLSFATWCLDPGREGPQTLLITRLRCSPQSFPTILNAAFNAARTFGLVQVEIWNLDSSLRDVGKELGGVTSMRDDHLSALAWYGEGSAHDVRWRYNEKFCWC